MSPVIDHISQARLIIRSGVTPPFPVILRYDGRDPLAVRLLFPADAALDASEAEWVFSRELLSTGLRAPAGTGDVRLWPCGHTHTMIELHAPEGMALVELRTTDLYRFLRRTYASVPPGHEQLASGLERGLAELLREV